MRIAVAAFVIALLSLPLVAKALVPVNVQDQLNQVAATGDRNAVEAESMRLAMVYPTLQAKIVSYMNDVALPASDMMAVINTEAAVTSDADSDDVAALAAELNAIDVGAIN